jgi:hypothetical protein
LQAATLRVLVDTIVPADEDPSGTEAGVLDYLERQSARDLAGQRTYYRVGLDAMNAKAGAVLDAGFAVLGLGERKALLRATEADEACTPWPIDAREFVTAVVGHVMEGFYGDPGNGGNHDGVSWRMIVDEPVQTAEVPASRSRRSSSFITTTA